METSLRVVDGLEIFGISRCSSRIVCDWIIGFLKALQSLDLSIKLSVDFLFFSILLNFGVGIVWFFDLDFPFPIDPWDLFLQLFLLFYQPLLPLECCSTSLSPLLLIFDQLLLPQHLLLKLSLLGNICLLVCLSNAFHLNFPLLLQLFNFSLLPQVFFQLLLLFFSFFISILILMINLDCLLRSRAFLLPYSLDPLYSDLVLQFLLIFLLVIFTKYHFARLKLAWHLAPKHLWRLSTNTTSLWWILIQWSLGYFQDLLALICVHRWQLIMDWRLLELAHEIALAVIEIWEIIICRNSCRLLLVVIVIFSKKLWLIWILWLLLHSWSFKE